MKEEEQLEIIDNQHLSNDICQQPIVATTRKDLWLLTANVLRPNAKLHNIVTADNRKVQLLICFLLIAHFLGKIKMSLVTGMFMQRIFTLIPAQCGLPICHNLKN